jgi:hypothetical protein
MSVQPEKTMQRQTSPAESVQSTASTMQRQTSPAESVQSTASTSSRKKGSAIWGLICADSSLDLHVDEDDVDEPKPKVKTESYSGPEFDSDRAEALLFS